ncbi:unclassified ABC-type transport system, ATPase component [Desulforapulum autotrophicum HRM2]|uniref:Unclassified ABC-type transport system, ATPase component n=1 Tax=Desulforapulum autotrophicum (strain ATCC 43914 / DSM 3382 / VKM B-1955 / HRM2) TaxID=177437 RepID=C0QJ63_DESAH|nr:LPS export ABC transporter ATP-binding protein [Desulforapulum autotrophicum]ACN15876.1 unclassified ABC-type transport system, ATPase component [Desulforapulum autotrophicum HRM2]
MTRLALKNLVKTYNGRRVVNGVNIEVNPGQVTGLLGPNGAGKTTTFYMAVGMIKPDKGQVFLDHNDITDYPMYMRARNGIGYLPQEASIFRKLTVRQNITAILEVRPDVETNVNAKADRLMEELGIARLADQKASVLSGGERRRLEISRVLATDPLFILLDEPFAGIDPLAVSDIQKIITHLTELDIGVLISDHNVRETLGVCNFAYIMNQGEVIESGNPEKITSSEIARRFYLGDKFRL